MIIGFLKIFFYALLAYIIYLIIKFFNSLNKASKSHRTSEHSKGIMVKDEVCNTYLPKEDAIKEIFEGKEYYFCSNECRTKFLESKKTDSS